MAGYDAVYCSPLERCIETARCLGIDHWIPEGRIAERHLGVFEGCTSEECLHRHPEEYTAFSELDERYVIPGGESRREHLMRVLQWLEEASRFDGCWPSLMVAPSIFCIGWGAGCVCMVVRKIFGGSNAALSKFYVDWPHVRMLELDVQVCPLITDHAGKGDVCGEPSGGESRP